MRLILSLILFSFLNLSLAVGQNLSVSELRCNYSVNPLPIDESAPILSWNVSSEKRGESQSAYELIVSTSAQFDKDVVWNTGKVISDRSVNVRYAGQPLKFATRYFWKVNVWGKDGSQSASSEVAFWETGIDPAAWKATWISAPTVFDLRKLNEHRYAMIRGVKNDFLEPVPLFRKPFNIEKEIRSARVYVAGLGFHELYINGSKISDEVLNPAFTNYDKTVLYNVYDVTASLKRGGNCIGMILGNGWYNQVSKEVWGFDTAPWRNHPTLRLKLELTYDDGTKSMVVSDTSWRATPGAITFSNLRQGEYYDARLEVPRWSEYDLNDDSWKPVRRVAGPIGVLHPQTIPPVKVNKVFDAPKKSTLADGKMIFDFGQNMSGFVGLKVRGNAGVRLQFRYAERLNKDGSLDQSNINNLLSDSLFQVDRYTLKGGVEETWTPKFVYHGFRFVEVSCTGPCPEITLSANAISTSFETAGEFTSSDEMVNAIQQSTLWSFKNNFIGFPTDCPQREKNGWTGDAQLACETGVSNFGMYNSYKKWLRDLRDEQQMDGSLPGIVPTSGWGYYWGNGPAWDIACIVIPWTLYEYTGDTTILSENYSMMKKYVDYMHSKSKGLIADFGLGDWIPVETETPVGVTSTGYFYYGAATVAKAATILKKQDERTKYHSLASQIRDAFHQKYFDPRKVTYANGSQTALSCALFHDLVPEKYKKQIYTKLVAVVHEKDDHIDTGILGAKYVPQVLSRYGDAALAFKLVTNKTYPGWGYWIENGATTLWEDWKGESSLNHIMLGDVSSWFYKNVTGIRPHADIPAFKIFIIKPELTIPVSSASATYNSVHGIIKSEILRSSGMVTHKITVPVGTVAQYYLPETALRGLKESNKDILKNGFPRKQDREGKVYVELASGNYTFSFPDLSVR